MDIEQIYTQMFKVEIMRNTGSRSKKNAVGNREKMVFLRNLKIEITLHQDLKEKRKSAKVP